LYSEAPGSIVLDWFAQDLTFKHGTSTYISAPIPDPVVNEWGAVTPYDTISF